MLKAYAINRGYRCMEGYIAKSSKVESLNTNPEGKIYPVLTHGRQTNVHVQLAHIARQVYLDTLDKEFRRIDEVRLGESREQEQRETAFHQRRDALSPGCLACGKPLVGAERIEAAGYFALRSDQALAGFIGRKHQIRIHLAYAGHPIVGDKLYGADEDLYLALVENRLTPEKREVLVLPYHALHASRVVSKWRGQERQFCAEPEDWFRSFLGAT